MLDAHKAVSARAGEPVPAISSRARDSAPSSTPSAAAAARSFHLSWPERQTEMLLLHEALARARCTDRGCSDRSYDLGSDRLVLAEAARVRQRHVRAARAHRRLEVALRKLERAAHEAERSAALASTSS